MVIKWFLCDCDVHRKMAVNGLSFSWAGRHLVTYQCIRIANLLVTCPYMSDIYKKILFLLHLGILLLWACTLCIAFRSPCELAFLFIATNCKSNLCFRRKCLEKLLQATTAFSPRPTLIIEEAIINEGNKSLPHGNIDFLVTGSVENAMVGVLVGNFVDSCWFNEN